MMQEWMIASCDANDIIIAVADFIWAGGKNFENVHKGNLTLTFKRN